MACDGSHTEEQHTHAIIGNDKNFWLYDSRTGFDLTHPATPTSPAVMPRLTVETTTSPIILDPAKSALVIIDMQNYFLSPALGRARGAGHDALDQLVQHAIPAARRAGVRILWINWGLSDEDIAQMPPAMLRALGFQGRKAGLEVPLDKHGNNGRWEGMGSEMGVVLDPASGKEIDAGKLLMRDQWNSALFPPLDRIYEEGKRLEARPDEWFHKIRLSGTWPENLFTEYLANAGVRSLLFAGVNTDQCVGGTLQDCFSKGFDCILLNDGCGTTSPGFAQQMVEFNTANTWGFQTSCKAFASAVDGMT